MPIYVLIITEQNGGQSDLYIAEIDLYKGTQKGRGNQHLKIKNI